MSKGLVHNTFDYYKKLFQTSSTINFNDPTDSLLNDKKKHFTYYSSDTHWNRYGGFKGHQALIAEIKKSFPDLPIIQEEDLIINEFTSPGGDLSILLGLRNIY
ncbi:MAG: hypothetical protein ABIR66_11800 [Saprospiraceae bacterium]